MTVQLSPEAEQRVTDMIQSGRFASPDAVVDTAVGLLADEDPLKSYSAGDLDQLIDEGLADVEAGRTYSLEELKAHIAGVLISEGP